MTQTTLQQSPRCAATTMRRAFARLPHNVEAEQALLGAILVNNARL